MIVSDSIEGEMDCRDDSSNDSIASEAYSKWRYINSIIIIIIKIRIYNKLDNCVMV